MLKLKQNQIDQKLNDDAYQPNTQRAHIPFAKSLEDMNNKRRVVEYRALEDGSWTNLSVCELNYHSNLSSQILKFIK